MLLSMFLLLGCVSPPSALPQAPSPPALPSLAGNDSALGHSSPPALVGSDRDSHGCIPSAGYTWCNASQKCIRSWEENCTAAPALVGGDRDPHGCIPSAGYSWCEAKGKCLRAWEENCTSPG